MLLRLTALDQESLLISTKPENDFLLKIIRLFIRNMRLHVILNCWIVKLIVCFVPVEVSLCWDFPKEFIHA